MYALTAIDETWGENKVIQETQTETWADARGLIWSLVARLENTCPVGTTRIVYEHCKRELIVAFEFTENDGLECAYVLKAQLIAGGKS